MPTQVVPLEGIEQAGMIKDTPAVKLPLGAWSDALNVRFDDGAIRRMKGQTEIFSDPDLTDIRHVAYWENPNVRAYVVINREADGDHAYLVRVDGAGGTIKSDKGTFSISDNWSSTQFNGGYSIIINNGIEAPHHITVQLGGSANIVSIAQFAVLPGWDSYLSGSVLDEFLSVSTDILVTYGNLLVAGALTERSSPQLPPISSGTAITTNILELTFSRIPTLFVGDTVELRGDRDYTYTWTVAGDGTLLEADTNMTRTISSPFNGTYMVNLVNGSIITLNKTTPFATAMNPVVTTEALDASSSAFGQTPYVYPNGEIAEPRVFDPAFNIIFDALIPEFSNTGDIIIHRTVDADGVDLPLDIVRDLSGVVRTSSVAAPGAIPNNWNPFARGAGTADEINLADAGKITAIRELRGNLFVFTSDTITQLRVSGTGLTAVPITKQYGAVAQDGVFGFKGTLLVVGSDDLYIFAGNPGDIQSIADGRVRKYFYEDPTYGIDPLNFRYIKIIRNQIEDELWVCYPTRNSNALDRALVWSYATNTWTQRDLPGIRSLTVGPIPGASTSGTEYTFDSTAREYTLTVMNANGQMTTQTGFGFESLEGLLTALNIDIDGQAGFASRIEGSTLIVNNIHTGVTPWTLTITTDVGTVGSLPFTGTQDSDRPWSQTLLNEAQNFVVMAGGATISAAEVGYSGLTSASIQRTHLQFAPTRETERLRGVYMNTMSSSPVNLTLGVAQRDNPGSPIPVVSEDNRTFDTHTDYKVDYHITSRLIDFTLSSIAVGDWAVADISLEVGGGGTR